VTPQRQEQKTAAELEWPLLLDRIAGYCQSEVAARRARGWVPEDSLEAARSRMQRTREALRIHAEAPLPAARIEDQGDAFEQLERGASVEGRELYALTITLELSEQIRSYLERHGAGAPSVSAWLATSPELTPLRQQLQRSIGPEGAILDGASPGLRRARQRAREVRDELRQKLTGLLGRYSDALQGQYVAERDGRYVLPVRSDAPFRVEGLVLGSSSSGGTLYVEPQDTHDLGNRVAVAEAEVRAEEARVLDELNRAVAAQMEAVRRAQHVCIEVDCLRALCTFAARSQAIALDPGSEPRLELRAMRHPLLLADAGEIVANDLTLRSGQGLVLSGPNAGGKTVALKCLGLAAWMVRTGIPLTAAEGSYAGWFGAVLTDVGDNQSLMHSLSTFSAHIENVRACLDRAGPDALVLIDELSGGTDPDEGAALACAVVLALLDRGAAVCVTTHYERLKSLAASDERLCNAAAGFDREHLRPTFRIEYGAPGASSALLVAQRYGIDPAVIARAESLLPEGVIDQRALARQLDEQRVRLEATTAEVEQERRKAAQLARDLERERERRVREEKGRLTQETQSVLEEVRQARTRLRQAEARLEQLDTGASSLAEARRAVNDVAQFVAIGGKLRRATAALEPAPRAVPAPLRWEELELGASVTLTGLGTSGKVVAKPKRDQVTVAVGAMKTTVSIAALSLGSAEARSAPAAKAAPRGPAERKKPPGRPRSDPGASYPAASYPAASYPAASYPAATAGAASGGPAPLRSPDNTLNLVGQRVEPALERLDTFIDGLLRSGEAIGFALHGHGTGALKNAVREHLARHPCVSRAEPADPEDGGDAFTVMWLG
jgi:DNA mismatch repair protein MutS2